MRCARRTRRGSGRPMGTSRATASPPSTNSTSGIGSTRAAGITSRLHRSSPTTSSRRRERGTSRRTIASPASRSRGTVSAWGRPRGDAVPFRGPRLAEAGPRGPAGEGGRVLAARPRMVQRLARSRRQARPAGDRRRRRGGRSNAGRRDRPPVVVEPGDRGRADRRGRARVSASTPKVGVVTFPGSLDDRDAAKAVEIMGGRAVPLWHADHDLRGADAVILPGGFSYGDYLRAGAIAAHAPIMQQIRAFAEAGGPVLGICNG